MQNEIICNMRQVEILTKHWQFRLQEMVMWFIMSTLLPTLKVDDQSSSCCHARRFSCFDWHREWLNWGPPSPNPSCKRPEWVQESPIPATCFFLRCVCRFTACFFLLAAAVLWPTRNHPGPTGSPKHGRVCDSLRWPSANEALNVYSLAGV